MEGLLTIPVVSVVTELLKRMTGASGHGASVLAVVAGVGIVTAEGYMSGGSVSLDLIPSVVTSLSAMGLYGVVKRVIHDLASPVAVDPKG